MTIRGKRAPTSPTSELDRLRGRVRLPEGRRAFRRVTLSEEGRAIETVDDGELEIELDQGGVVAVEIRNPGLVLVRSSKPTVVKGTWTELRERAEASGLPRKAVGPFADVELETRELVAGEPIEVSGTISEWAFEEQATFREGAARRPARAVAEMMAYGEPLADLTRAMSRAIADAKRGSPVTEQRTAPEDEAKDGWGPRNPAAWVPLAAASLVFGRFVVGAWLGHSRLETWASELYAAQWLALMISFRPWPEVPTFRSRDKQIQAIGPATFAARMILASTPFMVTVGWSWGPRGPSPKTTIALTLGFLTAWTVLEFLWNANNHAVLRRLASARRIATFDDTRGGTREGQLLDTNPVKVDGRQAALGIVTRYRRGVGSQADTELGETFAAQTSFRVETLGGEVEVDPDECVWATRVRHVPKDPGRKFDVAEWIPVDARVAVHGRYVVESSAESPVARLLAVGRVPAIVFATSRDGDPLARAARVVWHRRITLAALVGLLGAAVMLALKGPG